MVWTLCYAPHDWYLLKQIIHTRAGAYWKRLGVTYRLIWPCKDGYVCYRLLMAQPGAEVMNDLVASMNKEGLGENMKDISWTTLSFTEVPQEQILPQAHQAGAARGSHQTEERAPACE